MAGTPGSFVAPIGFGAARVAVGVLWLLEGTTKYRAHFGAADILLVAGNAASDSRVPDYFSWFAATLLTPLAGLVGTVVPLLEVGLGVALILGVLTLPAAVVSALNLGLYWSADQLIDQYPVMLLATIAIIGWPRAARRFSVSDLLLSRAQGQRRGWALSDGPLRDWL
jgi:DoxX.